MAPIRDKFTIHSKAVVCQDVELKGDITIGSVHPKATIFAIAGPIVIGMGCIIEEGAIIVNRRKEVMRIGDDNLFEIGCRVESPTVGNFNTVATRARVHHTVRLLERDFSERDWGFWRAASISVPAALHIGRY
ncbi:hypothetical protein EWM64_g1515 [Hericium alpestre]|uniref:Dynactin subunit 6 n=1 Tax=Hericium alpestre TaxID=135208 RepID=A0A4Z0A863_9AGAM|nr:hypothetical protein EWM64_g1515 [Hericium alpestre]